MCGVGSRQESWSSNDRNVWEVSERSEGPRTNGMWYFQAVTVASISYDPDFA